MRSRPSIVLLSAVAVLVGGAVAASVPAAATTTPPITGMAAPRPADSTSSIYQSPVLADLSCSAPGFCVAVGRYTENAGGTAQPLIETYSGGAWHGTKGAMPAGAPSSGEHLTNVSCAGSGLCAALGMYSNGVTQYIDTFYAGTWYATVMPAPADVNTSDYDTASSIACSAPSTCYAVGGYNGNSAFIATMAVSGGVPKWTVIKAPTPAFPPFYAAVGTILLPSVSCTGSGGCWAAGEYTTYSGDMVDPGGTPCDCGNPDGQGLLEALTPGSAPNPNWAPPIPGAQNSSWQAQFQRIDCGHGACLATGQFQTNSPTLGFVGTLVDTYTGAFAPTKAVQPGSASSNTDPVLRAASCATSSSCVVVGTYHDTTTGQTPLIVSGGTAIAAPAPADGWGLSESLGAISCFSTTTCLAASVTQSGISTPADTLEIKFGTGWVAAHAPPLPMQGTYASGYIAASCDSEQHCFAITDGTYAVNGGEIVSVGTPPAPPSVAMTGTWAPFTLASSISATWHGVAGASPIAHYMVQVRRSTWKTGFGAWSTPSTWASLPPSTSSVSVALPAGDDTCVRVGATDTGSRTTWTAARCIARPLDDPSLAGSATYWSRKTASGYYLNTYSVSTHLGATLAATSAQFDRLALVATRCPTCGKVAVYSGSTLLATVNLYAATTTHKDVVTLAKVSLRTANVVLKVTTSGKSDQIDGLGISRT